MIKTLTAFTTEIDDVEVAVRTLLAQLNTDDNLLTNSVGILACYRDFMETGVVKAICESLPFDVVGMDTLCGASPMGSDTLALNLVVLTSDDVYFSTALSDALEIELKKTLTDVYHRASVGLSQKASLILAFMPTLLDVPGDLLVEHLDAVSDGVPIFGALPSDFNTEMSNPFVIYDGEAYKDRIAIVLLSGDIKPTFSLTSLSEKKVLRRRAIITSSEGNILKGVNGLPVLEYMKSLGLVKDGHIEGITTMPLIVDLNDGSPPLVRVILSQTPDGHVMMGGRTPENSTLGIGAIDVEDVLSTMEDLVSENRIRDADFVMIISCATRNFVLGLDNMAEIRCLRSSIDGSVPYLFFYSGGEICPVLSREGKLVNRFHNVTMISCAF
jgi:hypothetical protein